MKICNNKNLFILFNSSVCTILTLITQQTRHMLECTIDYAICLYQQFCIHIKWYTITQCHHTTYAAACYTIWKTIIPLWAHLIVWKLIFKIAFTLKVKKVKLSLTLLCRGEYEQIGNLAETIVLFKLHAGVQCLHTFN